MGRIFDTQQKKIDSETVHDALKCFQNVEKLGKTPLAGIKIVELKRRETPYPYSISGLGSSLREVLKDAIETLKPKEIKSDVDEDDKIYYKLLKERFIKGNSVVHAAREIGCEVRTYHRKRPKACVRLAEVLMGLERNSQDIPLSPIPSIFFNVPLEPEQPLIGRGEELKVLIDRLSLGGNQATCAISGKPGVGKTTLAITIANDLEVQDHFKDGILWVGLGKKPNILGKLRDSCVALGISPKELEKLNTEQDLSDWIKKAVGDQQILFIVDDVWKFDDVSSFNFTGSGCGHLITARSTNLSLLYAPNGSVEISELGIDDGLELLKFWVPNISNTEMLRGLVKDFDGLPLGLELIGRNLRRVSDDYQENRVNRIVEKLHHPGERLKIKGPISTLSSHPDLAKYRQVSLELAISLSYDELSDDGKLFLESLSVFPPKPNTFSEDAALTVSKSVAKVFEQIVDLGLMKSRGENRYWLHQTIFDFASESLRIKLPFERMVDYYKNYLANNAKNYNELTKETGNIAVAFEHAISTDNCQAIIQIANQYFSFQSSTGRYAEAERNLLLAKDCAEKLSDKEGLAITLMNLGLLENLRGNFSLAREYFKQSLLLAEDIGEPNLLGSVLEGFGVSLVNLREQKKAKELWKRGLEVLQSNKSHESYCGCLQNLGTLSIRLGQNDDAEMYLKQGLEAARRSGNRLRESTILSNLSSIVSRKNDWATAEEYSEESLNIAREMGHMLTIATMLTQLGAARLGRGAYKPAVNDFLEALPITQQIGDPSASARLLRNLGEAFGTQGDYGMAEDYFQQAATIARESHNDFLISSILCDWGEMQVNNHNFANAKKTLDECLVIAEKLNEQYDIATACFGVGKIKEADGNISEARMLGERSLKIYREIDHYRAKEVDEWLEQLGD